MSDEKPFATGLRGTGGGVDFNLLLEQTTLSDEEKAKLDNDRKKLLAEKEKLEKQLSVFSEKTPEAAKEDSPHSLPSNADSTPEHRQIPPEPSLWMPKAR